MREMSLEEAQRVNVETLFMFADYCERHGYRYWLAYGTLLGAVRHAGVIPWDDDIDVWMPRSDYQRFVNEFPKDSAGSKYGFFFMGNDDMQYDYRGIVANDETAHSCGKRITDGRYGLHIDVFPLDYLDENEKQRRKDSVRAYRILDIAHRLFLFDKETYLSTHDAFRGFAYKVALTTLGRFDFRKRLLAEEQKTVGNPQSSWVGIIGDPSIDGYRASWFEDAVFLDFEGRKLAAPVGYREILEVQYGDYMKLPPEDERKPYGRWYWRS